MLVIFVCLGQAQHRAQLFGALVQHNVFEVLTGVMAASDGSAHLKATDIFSAFLLHDSCGMRAFLLKQEGHALFGLLMGHIVSGADAGLQGQARAQVYR